MDCLEDMHFLEVQGCLEDLDIVGRLAVAGRPGMLEDLDTGTTGNPRYWKHHKHRIFGNTEFLKTLVMLDIKDFGGPEYLHI